MATANRPVDHLDTRLRVRSSAEKLTPAQGKRVQDAVAAMAKINDERGYQWFARQHGGPGPAYCQHSFTDRQQVFHPAPLFLPWHRAYLHYLELAMQSQVADVTLTWWDWTSPKSHADGIPALYEGAGNPLAAQPIAAGFPESPGIPKRSWREEADLREEPLPGGDDVESAIKRTSFSDFSIALEQQLHNRVHGWVGGSMGSIPIAAFDPVFYAHHTMIDRIWRLWQLRHGRPGPPASSWDTVLEPFPITVGGVLDVQALGYDYAGSATGVRGTS
jgi:tyrosinase